MLYYLKRSTIMTKKTTTNSKKPQDTEQIINDLWEKYIKPAYDEYKTECKDSVPNYFVPDIENCSKKAVKYIILVESPHTDEVNSGKTTEDRYPLAGNSGKSVAKFLFNQDDSIGKLIKNKAESLPNMAIVNVCNVPLQLVYEKSNGDSKNTKKVINNVECYNALEEDLKHVRDNCRVIGALKDNLKTRIDAYNESATFIVCGEFAQTYFDGIKEDSSNFKALYVPHPSRNQWKFVYEHKDDVSNLKGLFENRAQTIQTNKE